MWLPGVRNLHSARETWAIKAGISDSIDRLVAGVEGIDTEECLEVHKVLCYVVAGEKDNTLGLSDIVGHLH